MDVLEDKLFKIYLDPEMVFYNISLDEIPNYVICNEAELYDKSVNGIPAFFKLEKSLNNFEYLPSMNYLRFEYLQEYAILKYKLTEFFQTKTVLTVFCQKLVDVEFKTHNKKNKFSNDYFDGWSF